MKKSYDVNAGTVTFTFEGELAPIIFTAANASAACEATALLHGWSARIGDGAALSRKQKDGSIITITEAMRRDEVQRLVTHYESGTDVWEMRAAGARPAPQNPTWLALAAKRGVSYDVIAAEKAAADLAELEAMAN